MATRSLILEPSSSLDEVPEELKPKSLKVSLSGGGSATGARVGSLEEVWSAVEDSPWVGVGTGADFGGCLFTTT